MKFWKKKSDDHSAVPVTALQRANTLLLILIIVINAYIIAKPLMPNIQFWWQKRVTQAEAGIPYKTSIKSESAKNASRQDPPKDNRLIIPRIALNQHIYTGDSEYLVHKGVWARPKTSTPDKGSNTVLVGHRFTYNGPATFYHLDKVQVGDIVIMFWQGKERVYKVEATKVVKATQIEIEAPTSEEQLTIYTCTPLWSAKDRLVVIAKPLKEQQ